MYEQTDENVFDFVGIYLYEWKGFYPDDKEMIPRHTPEAFGKYVVIKSYVDAKHAGNMANRRSHSGIISYVNNAPIIWYSKHQNTVEASSFGSDCFALRISTEIIEALRYKLRCFGIPVEGPAEVFCDNMSVVNNLSIPTSTLKIGIMPYVTTGLVRPRLYLLSGLGGFRESLTCQNFLQRKKFLGIQGIIWLIQYSLTQHNQLVILRRRRLICTWVHLSTSHTTRVFSESWFWDCINIFYSNRSYMVINLR